MSKFPYYDYNTTRPHLLLAEYGRNVQNMIQYIVTLPTKEERNRYAQAVIELMGFLNPHLRDVTDFKHKLWDHLFIISDFKLDVDSPYPIPSSDTLISKPQRVPYSTNRIHFKHYGKTVEMMIEKAKLVEEEDKRIQYAVAIANFMKMSYVNWNKDTVADETIINDLTILSDGILVLNDISLNRVEVKAPPRPVNNARTGQQNKRNNTNGQGNMMNRKRNNNPGGTKRF